MAPTLLKELMKRHGSGDDQAFVSSTLWRISEWKNDLIEPEQALAQAEDDLDTRKRHHLRRSTSAI